MRETLSWRCRLRLHRWYSYPSARTFCTDCGHEKYGWFSK